MRIAIDIDSTLHHYWDQLTAVVRERHGIEVPYEEQHSWGVTGLSIDDARAAIAETHRREHVLAAEPYPGAVDAVRRWHAAGHYIHITSHRSADAYAASAEWLEQIGLPYDDLHCSYDKVSRCVELKIDLLIDDSPVNLERALARGIAGATLTHPWNVAVCERAEIVCAPDWPTLERRLAL